MLFVLLLCNHKYIHKHIHQRASVRDIIDISKNRSITCITVLILSDILQTLLSVWKLGIIFLFLFIYFTWWFHIRPSVIFQKAFFNCYTQYTYFYIVIKYHCNKLIHLQWKTTSKHGHISFHSNWLIYNAFATSFGPVNMANW